MHDFHKFLLGIILFFILLFFGTPFLEMRTQPESTKNLLERRGYTNIQVDGYSWFACSEDDWYATSFKANPPNGDRIVEGTVCGGIFKGNTVRMD